LESIGPGASTTQAFMESEVMIDSVAPDSVGSPGLIRSEHRM
jgi:hypothetical protein